MGEWDVSAIGVEPSLGALLLDGLVTINVVLGDRVAAQLAGPGDLLHATRSPDPLLPLHASHFVSERTRVAILDRHFIAALRLWPALLLTLHERLRVQEHRLAVHSAIGKLRRVEDRIVALLWHLAERWGRVTADGVILPLALTHEAIGRLAGAERPTVTLAMGELSRAGDIVRRDDGAFVLRDGSRFVLEPMLEVVRPRPLNAVRTHDAPVLPAPPQERPRLVDVEALQARLGALRAELPEDSAGA